MKFIISHSDLPASSQRSARASAAQAAASSSSRETSGEGSDEGPCVLRYQQSIIEVYARFCVTDGDSWSYLADRLV